VRTAFRYDKQDYYRGSHSLAARSSARFSATKRRDRITSRGEIVVQHDFYSYDAKYLDDQGARLEIPARLPKKGRERNSADRRCAPTERFAVKGWLEWTFSCVPTGRCLVNEINTIPGFTKISM
jgi:D-alanine-D-alanine ligase-like ATP-grasp enzyme